MKRILAAAAVGLVILLLGLGLALAVAVRAVDYPVARLRPDDRASLVLTDRRGEVLRDVPLRGGGRQSWVTLDRVASPVVTATIASEDHRFFAHGGVDARAIGRAALLAARARRPVSGASTITMQLMRLVEEPARRDARWKLRQVVLALRLERALPKRAILEQYLNRAYYGNGAYGIEAAARRYFGKPAASLSLGEGTLLAVLPRAPVGYDPVRHLDRALARRQHVLDLMVARGLLSQGERTRALAEPLALRLEDPAREAPHFVDWVLAQLPPERRARGGVVRTTLDLGLQRQLEERVRQHLAARRGSGVRDAGVVVLDPRTGAVRAMVGSGSYDDPAAGQVNITTTPRHPGSALKPFIYALALEAGDTPATVAADIGDVPSSAYALTRAVKEHGPARYREALAGSYNLAAVHVLERVGVPALLERLRQGGLTPLEGTASDYGLSLALGSGKVRLVDLAAAYGFLVNGGAVVRATGLADDATPRPVRLFSPQVSWLVMDMLADADARRAVFGAELPLDLPFRVAAKTGTSSGFADTVAIGATREAIVAAWGGDFAGAGTRGTLAMWSAGPLVRAGLLAVADGAPLTLPEPPAGIVTRPVCRLSGMAPHPFCPTKLEHFIGGTEPGARCPWHRLDRGRLTTDLPPDFGRWAREHRAGPPAARP
ncbi:MAG TPA: transglycosylase domain-containing protein, partial [Polyangia bacterium]